MTGKQIICKDEKGGEWKIFTLHRRDARDEVELLFDTTISDNFEVVHLGLYILGLKDPSTSKFVGIRFLRSSAILPQDIFSECQHYGRYDAEADALYVPFTNSPDVEHTKDWNYTIMFDYDKNEQAVGVEILNVSKIL